MLDMKKLIAKLLHKVDTAEFYGHPQGASLSNYSLASGTSWVRVGQITLPKGVWLIRVGVAFPANATGRRMITLSNSSATAGGGIDTESAQAVNGYNTNLQIVTFRVLTASTTLYINAVQNSGSTLSLTIRYTAWRISSDIDRLDE